MKWRPNCYPLSQNRRPKCSKSNIKFMPNQITVKEPQEMCSWWSQVYMQVTPYMQRRPRILATTTSLEMFRSVLSVWNQHFTHLKKHWVKSKATAAVTPTEFDKCVVINTTLGRDLVQGCTSCVEVNLSVPASQSALNLEIICHVTLDLNHSHSRVQLVFASSKANNWAKEATKEQTQIARWRKKMCGQFNFLSGKEDKIEKDTTPIPKRKKGGCVLCGKT